MSSPTFGVVNLCNLTLLFLNELIYGWSFWKILFSLISLVLDSSLSLSFQNSFPTDGGVGRVVQGRFLGQPCSEKIENCGFEEELGVCPLSHLCAPLELWAWLGAGQGAEWPGKPGNCPLTAPLLVGEGVFGAQVLPSFPSGHTSCNCCPTPWRWYVWEYKPTSAPLSFPCRYWPSDPHGRPSGVSERAERTLCAGGPPHPWLLAPPFLSQSKPEAKVFAPPRGQDGGFRLLS